MAFYNVMRYVGQVSDEGREILILVQRFCTEENWECALGLAADYLPLMEHICFIIFAGAVRAKNPEVISGVFEQCPALKENKKFLLNAYREAIAKRSVVGCEAIFPLVKVESMADAERLADDEVAVELFHEEFPDDLGVSVLEGSATGLDYLRWLHARGFLTRELVDGALRELEDEPSFDDEGCMPAEVVGLDRAARFRAHLIEALQEISQSFDA